MKMPYKNLTILFALGFSIFGCSTEKESKDLSQRQISKAIAIISPTKGNNVTGMVAFTVVPGGVKIVADVEGLTPGKHGFHIHEKGDCGAHDASSAGGHFNPKGLNHGSPEDEDRHVGDLGNLISNAKGYAHYERIDEVISLSGTDSIVGRSIIVHADEDDFTTQPTGNAGGRVGCGLIVEEK